MKVIKKLTRNHDVIVDLDPNWVYDHFRVHQCTDGLGWLICDGSKRPVIGLMASDFPTPESVNQFIDKFRATQFH